MLWTVGLRHGMGCAGVGELGWSGKERGDQVTGTFACCAAVFGYYGGGGEVPLKGVQLRE